MEFDQFFLEDEKVIEKLISTAEIDGGDTVLEIGPGDGRVTKLLAKKAKKVVAIEIDRRFKPQLSEIPKLVVIFGNALDVLETRRLKFDKIVSSLPSSIVEPLISRLVKIDFKTSSFLVPLIFVNKIENNIAFNTYFSMEMKGEVPKESFSPRPKTNWALIKLTKKINALESDNYGDYLIQYLFEHPKAKLKNSLMEAVIKIYDSKGKKITKNFSRENIGRIDFEEINLDEPAIMNKNLGSKIKLLAETLCNS